MSRVSQSAWAIVIGSAMIAGGNVAARALDNRPSPPVVAAVPAQPPVVVAPVEIAPQAAPAAPAAASVPAAPAAVATAQVPFAICDINKVAEKLLAGPRYQQRITAKQQEIQAQLKPLEDRMNTAREKLQAFTNPAELPPEAQAILADGQQAQQEYQPLFGRLQAEAEQFLAGINYEAHREVNASIDAIAAQRGFMYVFASRSIDGEQPPTAITAFVQRALARPVLTFPKQADITADVLADLKLE
ncbi:MAG: hypothetical protein C0513_00225 [Isosphaera sp.]|nr:hypothetical protein [Isosphaera sp.]